MIFYLIKYVFLIKHMLFVIVDEYWSTAQYSYFYIAYNIYPTITIATIWKKKSERGGKKNTEREEVTTL